MWKHGAEGQLDLETLLEVKVNPYDVSMRFKKAITRKSCRLVLHIELFHFRFLCFLHSDQINII